MEPIINPLWFYLIDTVALLKVIFMATGTITIVSLGAISVFSSWDIKDFYNFWKYKIARVIAIVASILIIVGCLIPSSETAYKMLVASMITPDNIAAVGGTAQDIVDYIVNSIDTLLKSNG